MNRDIDQGIESNLFLLDFLVLTITFLLTYRFRSFFVEPTALINFNSHLFLLPLILLLIYLSLSFTGGYRSLRNTRISQYLWAILRAVCFSVALLIAILFFFEIKYVSRFIIFVFAFWAVINLSLVRAAVIFHHKKLVKDQRIQTNVLIVGSRSRARGLIKTLTTEFGWRTKIIGCVDPDPQQVGQTIVEDVQVIGTVDNIHHCLKNNIVDEVIVAISRTMLKDAEPIVQACEVEGITLRFLADVFDLQVARISLTHIHATPLLTLEPVAQDSQQLFAKRLFDLFVSLVSLPLLLPLFGLISIAIKLDSKGPVFFVQQRVGLRKHLFPMYKFRTMHIDAEARLKEIEHLNEAEGPIFKIKNDPRVTRVGRFLRRTSLDELPQFLNIIRGEMSLVGPRPMSVRDVELFDKGIQRKRFSVQPGLTCLWQISGRSNLPFDKWLELDLEYIATWSFWLDIQILFKTLPAVLLSKGAV